MDSGGCLISVLFSWLVVGVLCSRQTDIWASGRGQRSGVGICWLNTQIVRGLPACLAGCLSGRMDGWREGGMERTAGTVGKIPWPYQPGWGIGPTKAQHQPNPTQRLVQPLHPKQTPSSLKLTLFPNLTASYYEAPTFFPDCNPPPWGDIEHGSRLLDERLKGRTRGISFFTLWGPTPGITGTSSSHFLPAAQVHNSNCQEGKGPQTSLNPQLLL